MKQVLKLIVAGCLTFTTACAAGEQTVRFQSTSPYHHILVVDQNGFRVLSFDGSMETRMSLDNPLEGHFEYTEFFHLTWLWNTQISRVLMIGLGGASVQRSFGHYYPQVQLDTVELDPLVRKVARDFFGFKESARQRVHLEDGRVYLKRSRAVYDLIVADAYTRNRYGSGIPYHLATREFFELASKHLSDNGVMAYNVIGTLDGWQSDIIGSMYQTMASVFPNVYLFPASRSRNVVLIATKTPVRLSRAELRLRAERLVRSGQVKLPSFRQRLQALALRAPPRFRQSRVLTDDYAPVEGILSPKR